MNKRQLKKKYKKEHAHNPILTKQVNCFGNSLEGAAKRIINGIDMIANRMINLILELRTMPEEEFQEKLMHLTPEQQELAQKIRRGKFYE